MSLHRMKVPILEGPPLRPDPTGVLLAVATGIVIAALVAARMC